MAGTKSAKERNQITRAALAVCATDSRPKVNSLVFPRATDSGAGVVRLAFCKSVRWREAERTGKQRVVRHHAAAQTDRQMSCSRPAPYLIPEHQALSEAHGKVGGCTQTTVSSVLRGMKGILSTVRPGLMALPSAAQPGTKRNCCAGSGTPA